MFLGWKWLELNVSYLEKVKRGTPNQAAEAPLEQEATPKPQMLLFQTNLMYQEPRRLRSALDVLQILLLRAHPQPFIRREIHRIPSRSRKYKVTFMIPS